MLNRTLCDQLTDGQLEWAKLEKDYDVVSIGYGPDKRQYSLTVGADNFKSYLKSKFPQEMAAIDGYFELTKKCDGWEQFNGLLKLLPLWLSNFVIRSGLLNVLTEIYSGTFEKSTLEIVRGLTSNKGTYPPNQSQPI